MITAQDASAAACWLCHGDDPETVRRVPYSLSRERDTVVASLEQAQPLTARWRALIADLRAVLWFHRQWLRTVQELGAMPPTELAKASHAFTEPVIRACQSQADALTRRFHSNDWSPTETCRMINAWITVIRLRERLQGDLDRASGENQAGVIPTARRRPLSRLATP